MNTAINLYKNTQIDHDSMSNNKSYWVYLLTQKVQANLRQLILNIEQGELQQRILLINKTHTIIEVGLLAHIDSENGGEVSKNLKDFYISSILTISRANAKNNIQELEQISDLYANLAKSWLQISKEQGKP